MSKIRSRQVIDESIYDQYIKEKKREKRRDRLHRIGKWCLLICGAPISIVIFPISCCVRNPSTYVVDEECLYGPPNCAQNAVIGGIGFISLLMCCGCCCGNCGEIEPCEF